MSKNEKTTPKIKIARWKKLIFLMVVFLLVAIVAEAGLRVSRLVLFKSRMKNHAIGKGNDCDAIVFMCVGDSLSFGLYVDGDETYPAKLPLHFPKYYSDIPVKAYSLAYPGSNTSEGILRINRFFRENPEAKPDFALILYGINNHYNLRKATFWDWEPSEKRKNYHTYLASKLQLSKAFNISAGNADAMVKRARNMPFNKYFDILHHKGGWFYFEGFDDELLAKWVERDLLSMAAILRERGIEPVIITYHIPRHPHLNPLIRNVAQKGDVSLLDIEKPRAFYDDQDMFASSKKKFAHQKYHLNEKGYSFLADLILANFRHHYDETYIHDRLQTKKVSSECRSSE
jgi:GDSL-like Lipase/Acylhydrolase family